MNRDSFRAMGTTITLIAPSGQDFPAAARVVRATFEEEEQRFSRFREDSELSWVNASAGQTVVVSAPFANVTRLALEAAGRTGGLFDPTMLPALIAAGYDRDFDDIPAGALHSAPPERGAWGRWRDVRIAGRLLHLPRGVALDFGGIAKGWTADLAAERAARLSAATGAEGWVLVNAGGDVRLAGRAPAGGLPISVEDPAGGELVCIRITTGAVATSSTMRRRWGPSAHHLIDPRTGLPSHTGVRQATAWAASCAEAEVRATWALLTGPATLVGLPAVLLLDDGAVISTMPAEDAA